MYFLNRTLGNLFMVNLAQKKSPRKQLCTPGPDSSNVGSGYPLAISLYSGKVFGKPIVPSIAWTLIQWIVLPNF